MMRVKILLLVLFVSYLALSYGQQVTFIKNQITYTIECPSVYYDVLTGKNNQWPLIDSTYTALIDSIVTVQNQGDSLYIFIDNRMFIAYCRYESGEYYLHELQGMYYDESFDYINYIDSNHDGKLEFISVIGSAENTKMYVFTYVKEPQEESGRVVRFFDKVIERDVFYPFFPWSEETDTYDNIEYFKISKDKFYHLYQCRDYKLRYGVLDYTRDKAKEIYFRPISNITLGKWNKL